MPIFKVLMPITLQLVNHPSADVMAVNLELLGILKSKDAFIGLS